MVNQTAAVSQKPLTRRSFLAAAALAPMLWRSSPANDVAEVPGQLVGVSEADAAAVRELVNEFMTKHDVPGLSMAFAKNGQLKVQGTFGFADRDQQIPVQPEHRFRIASISKPITSVAVFRLLEQGRLSLDDRVFADERLLADYLNGPLAGDDENRKRLEAITVAHLLEHTCGGWGNRRRAPMFARDALDLDHPELIRWVLENRPLEHAPGEEYSYSNFGYCLLGRVIEAVTGQPYEEVVTEQVFRPADIRGIVIGDRELEKRLPDEVLYYGNKGDDPYGKPMHVRRMDAHGGWVASASELVRFSVHVDGNSPPADLLSAESLKEMTTPSAANKGYARGWAVNRANNWWHMGAFSGAMSILVRTHRGYNWAVLVNTRRSDDFGRDLDRLPWEVFRAIRHWPSHDLFVRG